MFRELDYQQRTLAALEGWIDLLKEKKLQAEEMEELAASRPHLNFPVPDFVEEAWRAMKDEGRLPASRASKPFSPREDGCGRPVPNAVLKVPTGGGKTWLAVSAVSRIMGRYLGRNAGFVLWIVPNEAIYSQTLRNLRDREHPYRQALDRAAGGPDRVRIMEKTDTLNAQDVETHLCVMLLMLQSANRQTRETLKMFQDRGDVHGFCPPEGNQQAHREALARTLNLDAYDDLYPQVKDSLGNALRIIRPVVVMDEGHRAISDLAFETLYGFNPCFVLELTATPKDVKARGGQNPKPARFANVLVDVTGRELDREGMVKMPLNLDARQGTDWRATLNTALEKLRALEAEAERFRADSNRYIRPIMLVQVERTGADQRESGHIHAEDVKELLLTAGFDEVEVAIKTAERNDLRQPENQNLLSPFNRVRVIITKQALQEGWDCPFAYVLCALAASSGKQALTQLVGRILRQPHAAKTGVPALDECHIVTHHARTASVVSAIKNGLERDGLGDLVLEVSSEDTGGGGGAARRIYRRPPFASTEIHLPQVRVAEGGTMRALHYEADILSGIDWRGFDPGGIAASIPENARAAENQLERIGFADRGGEAFASETVAENLELRRFDLVHAARMIMDIVSNSFVAWEIVERFAAALRGRGFDDRKLGRLASLLVEELRKGLNKKRNELAEDFFRREVVAGRIQFRLRLDGRDWRMPFHTHTSESERAPVLPVNRSLFDTVYPNELNADEREVALYLDGEETLTWWHRNVARQQYGLQGWRRGKIYPDFIFSVRPEGASSRITVLETKGDQLDNNLDTAYKRALLEFLSDNFALDDCIPAGQLELVRENGETVKYALVLMSEMNTELPKLLRPAESSRS